jgi:hypothetical protein
MRTAHLKPTSSKSLRIAMGITVPPTEPPVAKIPNAMMRYFLKWCPIVDMQGEKITPIAICALNMFNIRRVDSLINTHSDTESLTEYKLVQF